MRHSKTLKNTWHDILAGYPCFSLVLFRLVRSQRKCKSAIGRSENNFVISVASLWEIAIKNSLDKLDLEAPLDIFFKDVVTKGFQLLPIDPAHILRSATLPLHHRDPFDRLLIGQSLAEAMPIITKDALFVPYCSTSGLQVIW